jgi:hypothetical protein
MAPVKPPRLLGRGIPPSQPAPAYLVHPSPSGPGPTKPPVVLIASVAFGLIVVIVAGAVAWRKLYSVPLETTEPVMAGFARQAASADPIDIALAAGDLRLKTDVLTIDKVWIDTCQRPGIGKTPADQCDRQPFFERGLVKAIVKNGDCAPERPKDETLSFALEVNHRTRKTRLFVGSSGTLGGADAKSAIACVERALPAPDWEGIPHDHTRYVIGVLASYPAQKRQ